MNFVKAVLKDKMLWFLIIIFIVSLISTKLTSGQFIIIPVIVFLIIIFVWPYIELTISFLKIIKNAIYRFVKKKPVKTTDASIREIILDLGVSFFRSALDIIALFFILVSIIIMGVPFFEESFDYELLLASFVFYFFAVIIYMIGRHFEEFSKTSGKPDSL